MSFRKLDRLYSIFLIFDIHIDLGKKLENLFSSSLSQNKEFKYINVYFFVDNLNEKLSIVDKV